MVLRSLENRVYIHVQTKDLDELVSFSQVSLRFCTLNALNLINVEMSNTVIELISLNKKNAHFLKSLKKKQNFLEVSL